MNTGGVVIVIRDVLEDEAAKSNVADGPIFGSYRMYSGVGAR